MPPARHRADCERDPIKYANRPLEMSFDEYAAVREHLAKLNASLKGGAE